MRGKAEAVARRLGGSNAPARRRGARPHSPRRAEQEERKARISRREVQPSARLQIELLSDRARDGRGHGRAQRLLERPKRLHLIFGLDQDQAGRIEAELVKPMTMRMAVSGKTSRRDDEEHRACGGHTSEKRRGKTEGCRQIAFACRDDLMQRPASEPASRQMRIEDGKTEGESAFSARGIFEAWQKPAQAVHDLRAASLRRKGQGGWIYGTWLHGRWLHHATSPCNLPKQRRAGSSMLHVAREKLSNRTDARDQSGEGHDKEDRALWETSSLKIK